jgi:hypothetical protein
MRARLIKPSFFDDALLCNLPMGARLLFAGLWCLSDREGRVLDIPRRISADVFPHDASQDRNVSRWLDALCPNFIKRYTATDGTKVIEIINFQKHQKVHPDEKKSEIPGEPNENPIGIVLGSSSSRASSVPSEAEACTEAEAGVARETGPPPPQKQIPKPTNGTPRNGFASTADLIGRNLPGLLGERYSNAELEAAVGMLDQFRDVNKCHWPAPDVGLCHTLLDLCRGDPLEMRGLLKLIGKRKPGNGWGWLVTVARAEAERRAS